MPLAEDFAVRQIAAAARMYEESERRLKAILASATATRYQKARTRILLAQVERELAALESGTSDWLNAHLTGFYEDGRRLAAGAYRQDLPVFTQINRATVMALAADLARDNGDALAGSARLYSDVFTRTQQAVVAEAQIQEAIAAGQLEGLGPQRLAQRIVTTLRDGATARLKGYLPDDLRQNMADVASGKSIVIMCRDGVERRYQLRSYGETVARSASRMAASAGVEDATRAFGGDLVQISVHFGACPICIPIQGKVYSLSGRSPDFPPLTAEVTPPIHPRCAHVLMGAPVEFMQARGIYDRLAEFSRNDQAAVGTRTDYGEFLRGQSPGSVAELQALAREREQSARSAHAAH